MDGVRSQNGPEPRWLTQTRDGGGHVSLEQRGDCLPACIASILGLSITAIANTHGKGWWDRLQAECAKHFYTLAVIDLRLQPPPTYWIASVPSLNLPVEPDGRPALHCVVARGDELVHDPSKHRRYDERAWAEVWNDEKIEEGWVLVPLDPALLVVR